jgi:hypothetical protein
MVISREIDRKVDQGQDAMLVGELGRPDSRVLEDCGRDDSTSDQDDFMSC